MIPNSTPQLIFIIGANASGKSRLAISLAQEFNGEIVSADSRQVYRGLDIGSGKTTLDQRQGVAHHLIDIAQPGRVFSLFDYQKIALPTIAEIIASGRLPFVVGGTGLYVDSLAEGYILTPVAQNLALREDLRTASKEELTKMIAQEQSSALQFLRDADHRRCVRALEIIRAGVDYAQTRKKEKRFSYIFLGILWPREALRARIHRRLVDRLNSGMLDEVAALRKDGVPDSFLYNLGLEYRFALWRLSGEITSNDDLVTKLETAISRFARRQMTWFRRYKDAIWLNGGDDLLCQAREYMKTHVSNSKP